MAGEDHLKSLILGLCDRGVQFYIGGAVALVLHGAPRMTLDLDIGIEMSTDNVKRFLIAVGEMGLTPRAPVPPEVLMDQASLDQIVTEKGALVYTSIDINRPYRQIDVFINRDHAYAHLINDTVSCTIEDRTVPILSLKRLEKQKKRVKPMREQDYADLRTLRRLLGADRRRGRVSVVKNARD